MDTNSKNKLISTTWGTLLIIFILAAISVGLYAPIKDAFIKEDTTGYLQSVQFKHEITDLTRFLLQDDYDEDPLRVQQYKELESLKYYVKRAEEAEVKSNITDVNPQVLDDEIKDSQFYLSIKTDETGSPTIKSSPEGLFTRNWFITEIGDNDEVIISEDGSEEITVKVDKIEVEKTVDEKTNNIKASAETSPGETINKDANLEIVYFISGDLNQYNDLFAYNFKNFNIEKNLFLILIIGAISILILILMAFIIPYRLQNKSSLVGVFNKLYLEVKLLILPLFLLGPFGIFGLGYNVYYGGDLFNNSFNLVNIIADANLFFYLIGLPLTFILYVLIYLSIVYFKSIYYQGFKEGLLKNSIIGKVFFYCVTTIKKLSEEMIELRTEKESLNKLLIILGINLLALGVIAVTFPFNIILAIIYTIFLAKYLLKVIAKIRSLNEATREIAEGNFDVNLTEDIGVLKPIVKNLNNINKGFKVAVEKEIKSQKMKTELISNVSHDLKTPLTSIITYVDLLKNEEIEDEKREEYLGVLEQKSKRLQVLIEDLFEVSKASSGNIELNFEQIDVIALLRQTLGEMEQRIQQSTLEIRFYPQAY